MRDTTRILTSVTFAAALAVAMPLAVQAEQDEKTNRAQTGAQTEPGSEQARGQTTAQTGQAGAQQGAEKQEMKRWNKLRENTVSVRELMSADVTNGFNQVGNVRDLVLNEDATAIEYVLYEVPYPYSFYDSDAGFAAFDSLEIDQTTTFDLKLEFEDVDAAQAPEQLTLNRREADHRMVSRLLGDTVTFSGPESRPVEDILVDRETGEIQAYVVNENPDSWFNDQPRVVAADQVSVSEEGRVSAKTEFAALEPVE